MTEFLCSECGACCMIAGKTGYLPNRGDGACLYLDENNKCSIYEDRPDICRVKVMHKVNNPEMSKKEYYIKTTKACHQIIDLLKLDKKYKIPTNSY
tara:strand:- start:834 stop:1121 length:288 start_codon:yes stop_codon:yes gene_type:complete